MKNLIYPLFAVLLLTQACMHNQVKDNTGPLVDTAGVSFIHSGIKGGLTEIKISGLVITNSNNQKVIALAKRMIDDHTAAGDELLQLARDKHISERDTIDIPHQKMINDLSKKSGPAFDRAFLQQMINDHEQDIQLFSAACQNSDADIKNFATKTMQIMKMHLDSAKVILLTVK